MGRIQKQLVGGSILSHDHFQGGHYTFAMAKAPIEKHVTIPGFEDVEAGIVKWPLSVLRIRHKNPERLIDLATHVLQAWRGYTDEAAFVFANTDGEPHNTITPIARKVEDVYELDLTLRNNITTKEHPLGVYHPHAQYHHIKKENIGLIEVMGLAVLPARLKEELELLEEHILSGKDISSNEKIAKHEDWVKELLEKYPDINAENIHAILQKEVAIYNMVTPGTVDADIYERCLMRIGVFHSSIGDCEDILGEITGEIRKLVDNFQLSDEDRRVKMQQMTGRL